MESKEDLFGPVPAANTKKPGGRLLRDISPLWTAQKSTLISEYLHRFLLIAKSGVYIDLFAGPQQEAYVADWTIKRVIERRTTGPQFKYFAACDLCTDQVRRLRQLRNRHRSTAFKFRVYKGDANERVGRILDDAPISGRIPSFCLIDQRTLECNWQTVCDVSNYKSEGYKIEILYFLAEGWLNRSWKSRKRHDRLRKWWGRDDFLKFLDMRPVDRARKLSKRFRDELGYGYADPWPIYKHGVGGRTMYYLIHASDHPAARRLMSEAFKETPRVGLKQAVQGELFRR